MMERKMMHYAIIIGFHFLLIYSSVIAVILYIKRLGIVSETNHVPEVICFCCIKSSPLNLYMIWYGMIWYNMTWYDMTWYDVIWYNIIWYDMVWCNMIWYDMVWYNMI